MLTVDVFHGQNSLSGKLVVYSGDVDAILDMTALASEVGSTPISIFCFMCKVQLLKHKNNH